MSSNNDDISLNQNYRSKLKRHSGPYLQNEANSVDNYQRLPLKQPKSMRPNIFIELKQIINSDGAENTHLGSIGHQSNPSNRPTATLGRHPLIEITLDSTDEEEEVIYDCTKPSSSKSHDQEEPRKSKVHPVSLLQKAPFNSCLKKQTKKKESDADSEDDDEKSPDFLATLVGTQNEREDEYESYSKEFTVMDPYYKDLVSADFTAIYNLTDEEYAESRHRRSELGSLFPHKKSTMIRAKKREKLVTKLFYEIMELAWKDSASDQIVRNGVIQIPQEQHF